jgi:hypothetical protein
MGPVFPTLLTPSRGRLRVNVGALRVDVDGAERSLGCGDRVLPFR